MATLAKTMKGFQESEIFLMNRCRFTEEDFVPAVAFSSAADTNKIICKHNVIGFFADIKWLVVTANSQELYQLLFLIS